MSRVKFVFLTILALTISVILVILFKTSNVYYGAHQSYRVYLSGKSIGLIESKEKLEKYINEEQKEIKDKYNVNKVYVPKGLEINEEVTYNEKISKVEDIYNEIKEEEDFTIKGYIVTIYKETKETEDEEREKQKYKEYIYLLDKDIFSTAIDNTVKSFVDENKYDLYINENQPEIVDQGSVIENVYIKEKITIQKGLVPASEKIFTDERELSKYLLFGTVKDQNKYIVQEGDTISQIANANKLNTREFLIANTNIRDENVLLYPGQEVIVDLINPVITVVEEDHAVEYTVEKAQTKVEEDPSLFVGYTYVVQDGEDGESLVTKKIQKENGQTVNVINISTLVIKPAVNRIVKTGSRTVYLQGSSSIWGWPTKQGYTLTDGFGYRDGGFHGAQDIAGLGCNSPIYAANDGTVTTSTYQWSLGNYVTIDHHNSYKTSYCHLSVSYVQPGQGVKMGQIIGLMGDTGYSFGCHLHFIVEYQGTRIDPMLIYR